MNFTYRPWAEGGLSLNDDQLVSHVQSQIAAHGFWNSYGELAMGGGMHARIDPVTVQGEDVFRAIGGDVIKIQADYRTLDRALDMVALFARLAWDMFGATTSRDSDFILPDG